MKAEPQAFLLRVDPLLIFDANHLAIQDEELQPLTGLSETPMHSIGGGRKCAFQGLLS